jgi:uncharacterized membrane protein
VVKRILIHKELIIVFSLCAAFFVAYSVLALIKHAHFLSGYDLSVINQVVWEYSKFQFPNSTVHAYAFTPVFWDHVELILLLVSPFYWVHGNSETLIVLQNLIFAASGIPVYLLARKYKLNFFISLALVFSYFAFFGVQNALWSDVHSIVFGASFLSFFIYFLDLNKKWLAFIFLLLSITSKENVGLLTFLISFVYFIMYRKKINILFMAISALYLLFIFFVFFPYLADGYRFANENGLLSNINLLNFFNTAEKREVIFYTLSSFGFLPVLNPLALIPFVGDLGNYFVLGNDTTTSAQGLFGHYRIADSLLLVWPTILVISKFKILNRKLTAIYLLFFVSITTYLLHAPLTYLTKEWFWTEPSGVKNIEMAINELPKDAYVVTQVNISPHISNRELIVTMWGDRKNFEKNSPCGDESCEWFKWAGNPEYMLVDTSSEWNITHLLANREDFIKGLENMEKDGVIRKHKEFNSATIYTVHKKPY